MYSFLDLSDTQVLYCSVHSSPCLIFELTKGVMRGSIISGLSNQLCQCCCYAPTRMMMSWISQAAQAFCADSDNGHLQALQCARVLPVDPIFNLTVLVRSCFLCYAQFETSHFSSDIQIARTKICSCCCRFPSVLFIFLQMMYLRLKAIFISPFT